MCHLLLIFLSFSQLSCHQMPKLSSDTLRNTVVVVASCTICFLLFGTARLSGLLFPACRERYNVGRKEASLPFALVFTIRNLSGPFVGYLGNKFGLQLVTLLGCLLSAVAIGGCFFAEDIILITVLWGGFFGVGFGVGTLLIANILHLYFKASFNRIHGIYLASGCLGGFVLPGIAENAIKTYGTSGTFLILSAVVLHSIPAAMLLKNPEKSQKIQSHSEIKEMHNTFRISKEVNTSSIENQSTSDDAKYNEIDKFEDILCNLSIQKSDRGDICSTSSNAINDSNLSEKKVMKKVEEHSSITIENNKNKELNLSIVKEKLKSSQEIPNSAIHVDEINNINSTTSQSHSISRNLQVFLDPVYILILLSLSISVVVITAQYIIIADACRDKGIAEDVAFLMTFSISEMLGRIAFGYAADATCMSSLNVYILCCFFCGLFLIGFTWVKDFYILLAFVASIGALIGSFAVVAVGMIRDYIKKEHLTMAISSRYFLFGLLNLGQPSVIGYFRETLHSYDGLYYLLGSMCLLCAIIVLFIPSAVRLRDRKRNKTKDTKESFVSKFSEK